MQSDNTQLAILSATIVALGGIVLAAVLFGSDVAQLRVIQYLSSAAPALLGFVFINSKQKSATDQAGDTQQKVTYLAGTLNGKLDKRFLDLESTLTNRIAESKINVVPTATGEITLAPTPKDNSNG